MRQVEKAILSDTNRVHLGVKPIPMSAVNPDRVALYGTDTTEYYFDFTRILFSRHVIHFKKNQFEVMIDPLFNFEFGEDVTTTTEQRKNRHQSLRVNTRGIRLQGNITDKVSFMASFYENQAVYPEYIRKFIGTRGVVPGMGRAKPFGHSGADFAMSSGYMVVKPTKFLSLQYGHDKNFVGHGYRSLLLSDNSLNYPHLRVTWSALNNKLQYTSVFGKIQSLRRMPMGETREPNFVPKGFSYNYISFMPWKFLEIGLYESFTWKMYDPETESRTPFIASTINPVILVNTFGYGLRNENNGLVGLNVRFQPLKEVQLYGQAMLDDMISDKFGFQVGVKWFDAVIPNLGIQLEYNHVKPYTYGHEEPLRSYTHNNEYLAHPWGAGFDEALGFINYRWERVQAELKVIYGQYQQDYAPGTGTKRTNYGKEIYRSETDLMEGYPRNLATHFAQDFRVSYVVNPRYNLMVNAGVMNRAVTSEFHNEKSTYIYIGLRTFIDNQYFDF